MMILQACPVKSAPCRILKESGYVNKIEAFRQHCVSSPSLSDGQKKPLRRQVIKQFFKQFTACFAGPDLSVIRFARGISGCIGFRHRIGKINRAENDSLSLFRLRLRPAFVREGFARLAGSRVIVANHDRPVDWQRDKDPVPVVYAIVRALVPDSPVETALRVVQPRFDSLGVSRRT